MSHEMDLSEFSAQIEDSLLKDAHEDFDFELPASIAFRYEDEGNTLVMRLNEDAPHHARIQENEAAFESWALIIKAHQPQINQIRLDWTPDPVDGLEAAGGPYRQFLYRVWKFTENFRWFDVRHHAQREQIRMIEAFFADTPMVNALSKEDAGHMAPLKKSAVAYFTGEGCADLCRDLNEKTGGFFEALYGPMPVSLRFPDAQGPNVFEGAHSVIPLWSPNDAELCLLDLKIREKKIGALSEFFFNAHFMFDLYCAERKNIILPPPSDDTAPGAPILFAQWFDYLSARILSDALHPAITPKVVKTLQDADQERILFKEPLHYRIPKALR
jgi:hypothetical protein